MSDSNATSIQEYGENMFLKIKYIVIPAVILLISSFSCKEPLDEKLSAKSNDKAIKWESISTVFKGKDNKKTNIQNPVLIFFHTEWCIYCKKMDNEVFNDSEIAQYMNDNYINVRVNPEQENSKIELMDKEMTPYELMMHIGAKGFPTMLFFDSKMKPLTAVPGYVERKNFLLILKYLKEELYNKNISMEDFMKNPDQYKK